MVEALVAVFLLAVAISLRPLRCVGGAGPAWVWVATWAAMPVLWSLDRLLGQSDRAGDVAGAAVRCCSPAGRSTVVVMVPVTLAASLAGQLDPVEAVPSPGLARPGAGDADAPAGRGVASLAAAASVRLHPGARLLRDRRGAGAGERRRAGVRARRVRTRAGSRPGDRWLAALLAAFGEATTSGLVVAALVAFRPHQLATYTDRLYLPR